MTLTTHRSGVTMSTMCAARQHQVCPDAFSGCNCACGHSGKFAPTSTASGNNMPINNLTKKNFRDAVVRLAPIMEQVNEQVFDDYNLGQQMFGDTVRNAVLGGIIDEINIQIDKLSNDHHAFIFGKYLNAKFPTAVKFDDHVTFMMETKFGPQRVNLYNTLPIVYWNIDQGTYNGHDYIQFPNDNSIQLIRNDLVKQSDNPKAILQRGIELATKYGMTLDEYSIKLLAEQISAKEPPEHVNETIIGFRSYKINLFGYLVGSYGVSWNSETLTVDCPEFISHVKSAGSDWRMANLEGNPNQHQCGIYIHKDPATCLYEVSGTQAMAMVYAYGVVGDFEKGYRTQHCKIVKLWVFSNSASGQEITPQLAQGVYNTEKGIIVGAKYSDFLYDKEVAQWAGR